MQKNNSFELLEIFDPEMAQLTKREETRQKSSLCLVASENYASIYTTALEGSIFANKQAEGYPGNRFARGCEIADEVETLAIERCKALFGCEYVNVQGMSATISNVAVLRALLEPGDCILAMELNHGGHLSHGAKFHISGTVYNPVFYGVDPKTERIDMDEVERLACEYKPKLIICGASSYSRLIDYKRFSEIAHEIGAYLMVDIAHPVGLIAAGVIPSPIPYADVVTSSTHKTWRGPRGCGIVMCKQELGKKIDQRIFPGLQGAPKMDMIAARAVLFRESMTEEFKDYQREVLKNAQAFADELLQGGIRLVSGGTDTHLILADVRGMIPTGKEAEDVLASVGIIINRNLIPFDTQSPKFTSGIRLGSPALTTRGFTEKDMREVARMLVNVLKFHKDTAVLNTIRKEVYEKAIQFPLFAEKWMPAHK